MSKSLADLAERHVPFMFRVAYSLLRNSHDAEDAVQECLLKLLRIGHWQDARDERAFLARAVWRCALDRLPDAQRGHVELEDQPLAVIAASPEDCAVAASNEERLHKLIDALPIDLRAPLLLSGFQELTSVEIAGVLGIPEGTVRTRLKRARDELRRRW